MIKIYCSYNHGANGKLCESCFSLLEYAFRRLDNCPYGIDKPACNKCSIHCYRKNEREEIKRVMRFSGIKMLLYHPILAIMHLLDKRKEAPPAVLKKFNKN